MPACRRATTSAATAAATPSATTPWSGAGAWTARPGPAAANQAA